MIAAIPTRWLSGFTFACFLTALPPLVSSVPLHAQSGEEIMRTALDRYEQRMDGINDYTVVQEVMGFESMTYFERREVDGHSVFVPLFQTGSGAAQRAPDNFYTDFFELAERSERKGTETLDGVSCHVIAVTDFDELDFWNPAGGGDGGDFTPETATFFVDTDDYLVRRVRMSGTSTVEGEANQVTFTADLRDYREVEGVFHPFVTDISVEGFQGPMSEEDQEQMRESFEEMRSQMDEMPDQQREMMEQMMGGQLEQMEMMLAQGSMDMTIRVSEIRVNEGPPDN